MLDHPSNKMDLDSVVALFTYHPPKSKVTEESYEEIRERAKDLVYSILHLCPKCADRTAAIRKVREAVMTANAAIALSEK